MGRKYAVTISAVAVTAQQDLFYIAPAAGKQVKILGLFLSQSSDFGDAQAEILRIAIIRGHATVGSGGTAAPTPVPLEPSDTAAGFTARINDTTIASAGTAVVLHSDSWNVATGYPLMFPPELQPSCTSTAGDKLVVRLLSTPTDSLTVNGTLYVEEMG